MWKTLLLLAFLSAEGIANECVPRLVDNVVVACVCNATYCDGLPADLPEVPENGKAHLFVSNKQGCRLKRLEVHFGTCGNSHKDEVLVLNKTKKFQKILGFGGAFTDSTGIEISRLSPATQDQLMKTYFDRKTGSGYSIGRVPIGGTDFSTRLYTYDDVENDTELEHFKLVDEDYHMKIPYLKKARELNPDTLFLATAWYPPQWMKTIYKIPKLTVLKEEYYQAYADYLIKFLEEYKKNGIDIWAITQSNEPLIPFVFGLPNMTLVWFPKDMAKWIGDYMGPTLAASPFNETLIIAFDDNRVTLPWFVEPILKNKTVAKYVAGTAVHWYSDFFVPAKLLDLTRSVSPDKFIFMTEAAHVKSIWNSPNLVSLSWQRAEQYALSIIEVLGANLPVVDSRMLILHHQSNIFTFKYMKHHSVGWLDWNLVLDGNGGPSWVDGDNDAAIIVNPEKDEFYKQPLYYAIAHYSRFIDRGSVRVSISDSDTIQSTAFVTPKKETVIVIYNRNNSTKHVTVEDFEKGKLCLNLSPLSLNTIKYK